MRTTAAVIRQPGKPWEVATLEGDEPRQGEVRIAFPSGMCPDEYLGTGDSVPRRPIVGKGCQVTVTSVGRSDEENIRLQANGGLVGWQRQVQGHVFGVCNPMYDIPRLLGLYRARQLKLSELIT